MSAVLFFGCLGVGIFAGGITVGCMFTERWITTHRRLAGSPPPELARLGHLSPRSTP